MLLENVVLATIETARTTQPKSTIKEVLVNRTVPNRFRVVARVDQVERLGGQPNYYISWCRRCEAS